MSGITIQDRAAGAIMGAFVGDALGMGPHWYYNLAELRSDYGDWISDYTGPQPDRYHFGMKAGQLSQAGFILKLTLDSLVECGGYDEADFCRRMDEELLPLLDGTPINGPGFYTSQSIRDLWQKRVKQKQPWGQTGGHADTTEAIERTLALAVRYALDPARLADSVAGNTVLTQNDTTIVSMTVAFGAVLGMLVQLPGSFRANLKVLEEFLDLIPDASRHFASFTCPAGGDRQPGYGANRDRWFSYRAVRQRFSSGRRRAAGIRRQQRGAFPLRVSAGRPRRLHRHDDPDVCAQQGVAAGGRGGAALSSENPR